jgi:putative inorganic carbon (hco3(-)) transporter
VAERFTRSGAGHGAGDGGAGGGAGAAAAAAPAGVAPGASFGGGTGSPAGVAALAAVLALAVAAAPAAVASGRAELFLAAAAAAGAIAVVVVSAHVEPAWPLSLGIAATVLSGNSAHVGMPVGPDRVLIAAGLVGVWVERRRMRAAGVEPPRLPVAGVHWVLFVAALWAIGSAIVAGTITHNAAFFGLLDKFGLVPFAMFLVAPVAFASERARAILLGTLIALGAYLGLTAIAEGLGLDALVFPKYILDPAIGIHADRARGPFVEAEANGLALFACAVAATIGSLRWRGGARIASIAVAALCAGGIVFTLSRGVWLAAVLGAVVTTALMPDLRRVALPAFAVVAASLALALFAVPGLYEQISERTGQEESVWVRSNTNHAAVEMIRERPLTGFGWQTFEAKSPAYFEQIGDYPMRGVGEGSHNVFLSNASELGLPGAFLWLAGLALAVGGALVRRPPPELRLWRAGLLAVAIAWVVVAMVTPLAFAFPTLLLWTWAGVVWGRR